MRTAIALMLVLAIAGCGATCPEVKPPPPPSIVKVPVDRYIRLPEWATRQLPLSEPRANTPEEATRLACVRLGTLMVANCRAVLLDKLDKGENVDPKICDKFAVSECQVK
jgi:hypothetical protein